MRILIVGSGGREHALAWKCAASERVREVIVAPGNAGTALEPRVRNAAVAADDSAALVRLARDEQVDLTIIGPEAPLVAGIVDAFSAAGLKCFGPCARAAQLEGSKAFSKAFLERRQIPTARHATFTRDTFEPAYLERQRAPLVIKASGLAAGKGVIIATSQSEGNSAIDFMFEGGFGEGGQAIVVEEFMAGEEASFFALSDGTNVVPLAGAQDHKRVGDGDTGPNTGGMGAYSPAPVLTAHLEQVAMDIFIKPTVAAMAARGMPYMGVLYLGLMITKDGPKLVEYNCRFGDPECQVLMPRLKTDLLTALLAARDGRLEPLEWHDDVALTVVMASKGYPGPYEKGHVITGLEEAAKMPGVTLFHAGTQRRGDDIVAIGGRVLNVTALGRNVTKARARAYAAAAKIQWQGAFYRKDIGWRALKR